MARDLYTYLLNDLSSLAAWICARRGDAINLAAAAGSAARGTIADGGWERSKHGHCYVPARGTAGEITLADQGATDPTRLVGAGSLIVFGDKLNSTTLTSDQRLISKRDVGGTDFDWYARGAQNDFGFYDGAAARSTGARDVDAVMVGLSISAAAATAKHYEDGVYVHDYDGASTLTADDADVQVGALIGSNNLTRPLFDVMVFNAELTAEEIGIIYDLWNVSLAPEMARGRKRLWGVHAEVAHPSSLKVHLGDKTGLLVNDLSGNGNVGVVTPPVFRARCVHGNALEFHGESSDGGKITIAHDIDIDNLGAHSLVLLIRTDGDGGGSAGAVLSKGAFWTIRQGAAVVQILVAYSDGDSTWTIAAPADELEHILGVVHDKSDPANDPVVYIDGVSVAVTLTSARRSGSLTSDASADLVVGNVAAATATHDGTIEDFRVYNTELTSEETRDLYLETACKPLLWHPRTAWPESVAGVAGGQCGPWEVLSGTHLWVDNGTRRGLVCSVAGGVVTPQRSAYGTFYSQAMKAAGGNVLDVLLCGGVRGLPSATGQDGYVLRLDSDGSVSIRRFTNGASVATVLTSAAAYIVAGTAYQLLISRRVSDSQFDVWIRGGGFTTWTLVGSGTDVTHATTRWAGADLDGGDELRDFRVHRGAMTAAEYAERGLVAA